LYDKAMLGKKAPAENKRYRDLAVKPWLDVLEAQIIASHGGTQGANR
jgi:hypothetical protein